jgi:RNA polymerase sigma-70 factor (ECF subfamily)
MEERRSIARLKQGDLGGLEELARRYYLQAVRAAYLVVRDQALAEDIVQASFIALGQKIGQFDDARAFRPWFLRSVINNAISACRQRKRDISLDDVDEEADPLAALERLAEAGCGPEEECITEETRQGIWRALEKLTPQQRAAVVLRYYLEMGEDEIVQQLGRPKSTVKWLLYSARKKLRQLLRPLRAVNNPSETALQDEERSV